MHKVEKIERQFLKFFLIIFFARKINQYSRAWNLIEKKKTYKVLELKKEKKKKPPSQYDAKMFGGGGSILGQEKSLQLQLK